MQKIDVEQAYKTIAIIWFALLMSQFMFIALVFFTKPELFKFDFSRPILGQNAVIIVALAIISVADLAVSLVLKRKFLNQAVDQQNVGLVQTAMIIGSALCEAISLIGLFLAFAFDYQYFFLFSVLGIFGILLHFPLRSSVHAASFKT